MGPFHGLAVVLVEKLWVHGEVFSRAVGVAALAAAVAVIWVPGLAPGLHGPDQMSGTDQMSLARLR